MASKKESNFFNMVSTLLVISIVASISLGAVYNLTKGPIDLAKQKKQEEAIRNVLPEFDRIETIRVKANDLADSLQFNMAYKQDEFVGVAINTFTNKGFSGNIKIMVGLRPDGTIHNTSVLEHKETPGLGDKMQQSKSDWSLQFNGKNPESFILKVKKDGGSIDAITAATISSRAFTDAVQRAFLTYESNKGGTENE
ncbi:MAG: RnfABCDGE type electron transport complex subunit G [Bacteroidales bacterium]|nr:RnfABCDGE type electron transport complex subunit G [Bacteroidales bacterium]